jgi:hypothetical protein
VTYEEPTTKNTTTTVAAAVVTKRRSDVAVHAKTKYSCLAVRFSVEEWNGMQPDDDKSESPPSSTTGATAVAMGNWQILHSSSSSSLTNPYSLFFVFVFFFQ